MERIFLFFIILVAIFSCKNTDDKLSSKDLCNEKYYYSENSKIYFHFSVNEVWIEFKQKDITKEKAESILKKYTFLKTEINLSNKYNKVKVLFSNECDCNNFKNYLIELNKNSEIFSASPVFYFTESDPDSYCILQSEILTKHNDQVISESDFIQYAKTLNLELLDSSYSTQHFRLKEVNTGFEALELANYLYESGKVEYSHPNFIMKIVLDY